MELNMSDFIQNLKEENELSNAFHFLFIFSTLMSSDFVLSCHLSVIKCPGLSSHSPMIPPTSYHTDSRSASASFQP